MTAMKKMIAAVLAVSVLATGCDLAISADEVGQGPAPGTAMCAPGVTDCVDVVVEDGGDASGDAAGGTRLGDDSLRTEAQALLGTPEGELPAEVRVGRRGREQMMLTEDYVVGRMTVELDDAGDGTWVVAVVTVELGDGPETFGA